MTHSSVYEETIANQRLVSAPDKSAWVAANAGAGKTKVLTDRVMRLLLTGTAPSRILCITFTKAAAAEMAERLFKRLGRWALMEDAELAKELTELDQRTERSAAELSNARRLFARALETPGGLKIQTIHSFCEALLKRFPLEAGVVPGFRVIEEKESEGALQQIIDKLIADLFQENEGFQTNFLDISRRLDEQTLKRELLSLIRQMDKIAVATRKAGGEADYWQNMASLIGITEEEEPDSLSKEFFDNLDFSWLEGAYSALLASSKTDIAAAAKLRLLLDANDTAKQDAATAFFLTSTGTPRKKLAHSKAIKILPEIAERLSVYQQSFMTLCDKLNGYEIYRITKTQQTLARFAADRYAQLKQQKGWLDFDDLINRTASLFENTSQAWVMYKLDQGIDHLLLDEAQDTSDTQWRVVMHPLKEFFAGESAREVQRTTFVVGDEKQSIYSFQGADVNLFREQQYKLSDLVLTAGQEFAVRDFNLSFRSVVPVLDFVDAVFNDESVAQGVTEHTELRHFSFREGQAGCVELWPLVGRAESRKGNPWDAPVDMPAEDSPARVLAGHISDQIALWLERGEILQSQGRAIQPGNILILCQRRGPVFLELVDALTRRGIPTTGADRLRLKDHVAIKDMIAAIRFILQSSDDLSLAELLKSPLFGFDDGDLFEIAYGRGEDKTLWQSLVQNADKTEADIISDKCKVAVHALREARTVALLKGPVAFFSYLMETGTPSGWQRYYARLGLEVQEVLNEFLDEAISYEREHERTLQGFLAYLEALDSDLKKEIDGTENLVRIMTVHGSKGLEGEIVFLADAAYENFRKTGSHLTLVAQNDDTSGNHKRQDGYIVRAGSVAADNMAVGEARREAVYNRSEEYRRLFYVAMTRARDRLYICGQLPGTAKVETLLSKPPSEATWYALATSAFERLREAGRTISSREADWEGQILRLESQQTTKLSAVQKVRNHTSVPVPAWLRQKAEKEAAPLRLQPSRLSRDESEVIERPQSTYDVPYAPVGISSKTVSPYLRGNALHLLLEKLPDLDTQMRGEAGHMLLQKKYPELSVEIREEWVAEVITVLNDKDFARVFGPGSRAEVPVIGKMKTPTGDVTISGQIDRLLVRDHDILIVDYKTNRPPPQNVTDIPLEYQRQLAAYRHLLQEIYPDHQIQCALLWTWEARLMELPSEMLDHVFVQRL